MKKTTDERLLDRMKDLGRRDSVQYDDSVKKLMILSTPRSGSTLFCDVLNQTQKLGECAEWLNMRYINAYGRFTGNSDVRFDEYFNFIASKTIGDTGVLAINMHIEQHQQLLQNKLNIFETLNFDHVIYVSRRDKLAQAISLAKAWMTDQWSADAAASGDSDADPDTSLIAQALHHVLASEKYFVNQLRALTGAEYVYEDFSQISDTTAYTEVFEAMGVKETFAFTTEMKRQGNKRSSSLKETFIRQIQGN